MVTNSSEYYPGIPVYHSRDLVNWKMIAHALNRPSQLNLDSVDSSRGIFAPTIRYHEGVFYVLSTLTGVAPEQQGGNFIVTSENPEGLWSEPFWLPEAKGIDPSLFFDDDGKVWYHGNYSPEPKQWNNHRNLWIQELDLNTMKLTGPSVDIINGFDYYNKGDIDGGIEAGVDFFEAPHIYKREGYYYLLAGHGGTFQNHAVSIWRSKDIFGPYESNPDNPILTHRDLPPTHELTSVGHGDLVRIHTGEWWMVYLGRRPYGGEIHILGRETFLSPVEWGGEWPVVNPKGKRGRGELIHEKPKLKEYVNIDTWKRDEFEIKSLANEWTFLRTPRSEWWSLTARKGFLRMQLRPERINEIVNPSFIGIRQVFVDGSAKTRMEFSPAGDNEEAGLVVQRDRHNYFKFTVGAEKERQVIQLIRRESLIGNEMIMTTGSVLSETIHLKITAEGVYYTFAWSEDGVTWNVLADKADGRFLGMAGAGRFTGTFIGMYASSNGKLSGNYADFDWFEYNIVNKSSN